MPRDPQLLSAVTRRDLRKRARRRRRRVRLAVIGLVVVAVVGGAAGWWLARSSGSKSANSLPTSTSRTRPPVFVGGSTPPAVLGIADHPAGVLGAPVQDAVGAGLPGGRLLLAGGLTAADTSTAAILVTRGGTDRVVGQLPVAVHDAAAVKLGSDVFVFGGGDGTAQRDEIVRIDPATG